MSNHDPKQIRCKVTNDSSTVIDRNLEYIIEDIYARLASHAATLASHDATLANHEARLIAGGL